MQRQMRLSLLMSVPADEPKKSHPLLPLFCPFADVLERERRTIKEMAESLGSKILTERGAALKDTPSDKVSSAYPIEVLNFEF